MRVRFVLSAILFALSLSSSGNLLAATLCPHTADGHSCCRAMAGDKSSTHETMGGMEMASRMEMERVADANSDANAVTSLAEACYHCLGHSQCTSTSAGLREANEIRANSETRAHVRTAPDVPLISTLTNSFQPHGPPGQSTRRHVLINTFRI